MNLVREPRGRGRRLLERRPAGMTATLVAACLSVTLVAVGGWAVRWRRICHAIVAMTVGAAGLTIASATGELAGAAEASPPGPASPYAHDPIASINGLRTRGEALGWHIPSGRPEPTICKHWQGIARSSGMGTPYLFVTRNGNAGFCQITQDDDPSGDLSIVRLATRDPYGERLRSNRLKKDTDIVDTAPPTADRVVSHISFDGSPIVGDDDGATWPHYMHPGGVQLVGDVLAIAMETVSAPATPTTA